MTWLNEVENPGESVLLSFIAAKSGKGFLLNTADYSCFIWSSDKLAIQLSEALAVFSESHSYKALKVVPNKTEKRGFVVDKVKDTEAKKLAKQWFLRSNGYAYEAEQESVVNPFLE